MIVNDNFVQNFTKSFFQISLIILIVIYSRFCTVFPMEKLGSFSPNEVIRIYKQILTLNTVLIEC